MLTWWIVFALIMAGALVGIWITKETDRLARLPEDEQRRFRWSSKYTIGLLIALAIGNWGMDWLPWMAALDIPVRITGAVLSIYCTIQLWRAYLRVRTVLWREG